MCPSLLKKSVPQIRDLLYICNMQVSVVPRRQCGVTWNLDIEESLVCVSRYDGLGALCQGASGAPIVTIPPQGGFVQVAVVHAGDLLCGEGAKPTLMTLLNQERLEWIYQLIDDSEVEILLPNRPT